jgi:uncharacterized protein (DUF1330 family)
MPTYVVAQIRIDDRERYGQYEAGFLEIFGKHGGELLAVDDDPRVVEGQWPFTRMVVLRFPDEDAAEAWYRSPEYQKLAEHRFASSEGIVAFAKGIA